jgi:hypothetical protein
MIFAAMKDGRTVLLMLSELDFNKIRDGQTLFIDERHIRDMTVNRVILGYGKTDDESEAIIRRYGRTDGTEVPFVNDVKPNAGEVRCTDCKALMPPYLVLEGKCIFCWHKQATAIPPESH